jgi:hypothetical protein
MTPALPFKTPWGILPHSKAWEARIQTTEEETGRSKAWSYLFGTAMTVLAIGATLVYGLNRDVVDQADGIKHAQSKMDVPLAPP